MNKIPFYTVKFLHKSIKKDLISVFIDKLNLNNFILGEKVFEFEKEFSKFLNCKYTIGVGNGLDALFLSLASLDLTVESEVIMPSFTCIASALAVTRLGLQPVLVDVNNDFNINYELIEKVITKKTKVILAVNLFGQSCHMDKLEKICNNHNLILVEDNAQAVGCTYDKKFTGTFGKVNATSFYPSKNLGALGDGGAVTTNCEEIYEKILRTRNYGSKIKNIFETEGVNSRLDEIQAAFLLVKLKTLNKIIEEKESMSTLYFDYLSDTNLILPPIVKKCKPAWHIFCIRHPKRDKLKSWLAHKGIKTQIHYPFAIHQYKIFKKYLTEQSYPISENIVKTCLSLPLFPGMKKSTVKYICDSIKEFLCKF